MNLELIFGVPALRNHRSAWPPSSGEIFLSAYAAKFVFFGVAAAVLTAALTNHYQWRDLWVTVLKYGVFFAGAVVNLTLCYWVTRAKQARPFLTPIFFAAPMMLVTALTVPFMWYGGGAIGGLAASGRRRTAAWLALGLFCAAIRKRTVASLLCRDCTAACHDRRRCCGKGIDGGSVRRRWHRGVVDAARLCSDRINYNNVLTARK